MVLRMAMTATIVLPLPTSPSTRRFIGEFLLKSLIISQEVFLCALVSLNGKFLTKFFVFFSSNLIEQAFRPLILWRIS